jgi:hypothetical protein
MSRVDFSTLWLVFGYGAAFVAVCIKTLAWLWRTDLERERDLFKTAREKSLDLDSEVEGNWRVPHSPDCAGSAPDRGAARGLDGLSAEKVLSLFQTGQALALRHPGIDAAPG